MPKMKTKSGAKKRFKVTASGKVKAKCAHSRHRLISKPTKMKRNARGTTVLCEADGTIVLSNFLPYARKRKKKANAEISVSVEKGA